MAMLGLAIKNVVGTFDNVVGTFDAGTVNENIVNNTSKVYEFKKTQVECRQAGGIKDKSATKEVNGIWAKTETKIMDSICDVIEPNAFNTWFSKVDASVEDGKIKLYAPNKFVENCIKTKYLSVLNSLAAEMKLGLEISNNIKTHSVNEIHTNDNVRAVKAEIVKPLATDAFSFDNFYASTNNEFTVAAVKKVASAMVKFSPLVMVGESGSGKTHLVRALRNEVVLKNDRNIVFTSGDKFASDFIRSLKDGNSFAFKDAILSADVLVIDGIETLVGKKACTDEFESLLVALIENGGNVVLTTSVAPSAISGFSKRLQSVLASGIVCDLEKPNFDIKKKMLAANGIDNAVAEFVASNSDDSGHIVSGIVKKISVWQDTFDLAMNLEVAAKVIGCDLVSNNTPEDFVKKMCSALAVSMDEILSNRRQAKIVRARQMIMAVLKTETNLSLMQIGRLLGNKDHATVLYGINSIEKLKSSDLTVGAEIEMLKAACKK